MREQTIFVRIYPSRRENDKKHIDESFSYSCIAWKEKKIIVWCFLYDDHFS